MESQVEATITEDLVQSTSSRSPSSNSVVSYIIDVIEIPVTIAVERIVGISGE